MGWINRKTYLLYFYTCFIIFLIIRYFDGLFLTQISSNPIRSPRVDLNVWLTQASGIPEIVGQPLISYSFDFLIIVLPLIILYKTFKEKSTISLIWTHAILFLFYILIIYCFPTLSIRKYLGLVLLPFAFIFVSESRYKNTLEVMRYFVLFIFTSASMWKIIRGVAWDNYHMQLSLKAQHIDNFVHWSDHYITQLIGQIIDNPTFCALLFGAAVLSQIAFAIGFFTKKYDRLIAGLLLIFIVSDYLVMRIEYWEFIVFMPLFLQRRNSNSNSSAI
ncbi:MAG: hypothetical protein P1U56_16465 [Saprospiraceae bacterium]|nr:hypothetical protein [Saprospiraceae bacterium]